MTAITIIGGHGKVALRLAALLTERGDQVTSWVRNLDHVADVEATGATAEVIDVEKTDVPTMIKHLEGQDALVWSAGAGGGNTSRTYAVDRDAAIRSIDAAAKAHVERYVMVSYYYDEPHSVPQDNPFYAYAEAKQAADRYLRGSNLDWTIVGPSRLTLDPGTGRIATRPAPASSVSRDDVAAVIAAVLTDPSTIHETIDFSTGEVPIAEAIHQHS